MSSRRSAAEVSPPTFRIGEVAKLTGLTARTLRYWEELGLISPSAYRGQGERRYSQTDMARVTRIRELQELLGFSLAEVRVVLDMEDIDVLDRVRSEYRWGGAGAARRVALLEEAMEANDKLLERLDSTLARIGAFRDERAEKAVHLRQVHDELVAEVEAAPAATRSRRTSTGGAGRRSPAPAPRGASGGSTGRPGARAKATEAATRRQPAGTDNGRAMEGANRR